MIELPQRRAHHWENHQSLKRLPVFFQNSSRGKTRSRQTVKCANFRPDPICWINFPTPISSSPTSCGVQSPWWLFKAGGTKALSGSDLGSPAGLGITGVSMHCANTLMTISSILRMVRMIVVMIECIYDVEWSWYQISISRAQKYLHPRHVHFVQDPSPGLAHHPAVDNIILPTTVASSFLLCHGQARGRVRPRFHMVEC